MVVCMTASIALWSMLRPVVWPSSPTRSPDATPAICTSTDPRSNDEAGRSRSGGWCMWLFSCFSPRRKTLLAVFVRVRAIDAPLVPAAFGALALTQLCEMPSTPLLPAIGELFPRACFSSIEELIKICRDRSLLHLIPLLPARAQIHVR